MGVKSTVKLSRQEAIIRAADLHEEINRNRRRIEAIYTGMSDKDLEDALEKLNDERSRQIHGGTGFENYQII